MATPLMRHFPVISEGGEGGPGPEISDFLARLSQPDRCDLEQVAHVHRVRKGDHVFKAGAETVNVYFLKTGRVKIYQPSPLGKDLTLWFCFTGEVFGLAEVAQGSSRVVSALAVESSQVMTVGQTEFNAYLEKHPAVSRLCLEVLASRLRVLSDELVNFVSDDVFTRVAKLMVRLAGRYGSRRGSEIQLSIPLTHQEIAEMVGTSRQTVSSIISDLKRNHVLSIANHRILIESESSLNQLARR